MHVCKASVRMYSAYLMKRIQTDSLTYKPDKVLITHYTIN